MVREWFDDDIVHFFGPSLSSHLKCKFDIWDYNNKNNQQHLHRTTFILVFLFHLNFLLRSADCLVKSCFTTWSSSCTLSFTHSLWFTHNNLGFCGGGMYSCKNTGQIGGYCPFSCSSKSISSFYFRWWSSWLTGYLLTVKNNTTC